MTLHDVSAGEEVSRHASEVTREPSVQAFKDAVQGQVDLAFTGHCPQEGS